MSKKAKISFLCAFLALIVTVAVQFMTGAWINLNSVLLGVAGVFTLLAVIFDWRLYWDFLSMRTTKHGMNMGLMIILVVGLLVCVNYLANKNNKTWDLTHEKLNSLSEQTTTLLKGLKQDLSVKIFYKGPQTKEERQRIKQNLDLFQDYSGKVKVQFINSYVDELLAKQYLTEMDDREAAGVFVFVEYGPKKVRVDAPFDESAITSALIKVTRETTSKIYFVQGHGERDLNAPDDQGLKDFADALKEASFEVEPLSLIDRKAVPEDAAVVAIIGPTGPYLDSEIQWLREYKERGGRLLVAVDPGTRHNLANLTKSMGVQFANNFIVTIAPVVGGGPAAILGRTFDPSSQVTKSFPANSSFAFFPMASEVTPAEKVEGLEVKELVKSDASTFTVTDISRPIQVRPDTKAVTLAVEVSHVKKAADATEGTNEKEEKKTESSFAAVIFGDSDFVSNRALMVGENRNLALNAMARLADQVDLISLKPKLPKGTMLAMTNVARWCVILGGMSLPIGLLILSGVMWFRRRGA